MYIIRRRKLSTKCIMKIRQKSKMETRFLQLTWWGGKNLPPKIFTHPYKKFKGAPE